MTRKVLLIGLDGATFTILDPLMKRGVMPYLRDLVGRGARGPLRRSLPALTLRADVADDRQAAGSARRLRLPSEGAADQRVLPPDHLGRHPHADDLGSGE